MKTLKFMILSLFLIMAPVFFVLSVTADANGSDLIVPAITEDSEEYEEGEPEYEPESHHYEEGTQEEESNYQEEQPEPEAVPEQQEDTNPSEQEIEDTYEE